jgi:hypothetical protein
MWHRNYSNAPVQGYLKLPKESNNSILLQFKDVTNLFISKLYGSFYDGDIDLGILCAIFI